MAQGTLALFDEFAESIGDGRIDLDTDTFKVAFVTQPARTITKCKGFIESAEEYLSFQSHPNLLRVAICFAVDQYCAVIAINYFARLIRRWSKRRAAETLIITTASKMTFDPHPCGSDN